MNTYKRIISIISACVISVTLSGCNSISNIIEDLYLDLKAPKIAEKQAEIILDCLKTGNSQELEALFCKNVASSHNLKVEIAQAIEFIDGNIIDDGRWSGMSSGGMAADDGKISKLNIYPTMYNVKTDIGKEYDINFCSYMVYEKDPDYVGMTRVNIRCGDNYFMIGETVF